MKLLIATHNAGKKAEYAQILADLGLSLVTLTELGIEKGVEETGVTYAENALLKARAYADLTHLPTVADDSGLEVDALGGAPGVLSARYAGEGATDADRNRLLLEKLEGLPHEKRGAHFTSAVVVARGDTVLFQAQESVGGFIAEQTRGPNGFGYDPLFFYPPFGKTFGEVPRGEKDQVSHRGKAFARLRTFLTELVAEAPQRR